MYYQAALSVAWGFALAAAPRWVLHTLFGQTPMPDVAFVRIAGALSIGLALMMVLVAQKIEETWWWAWAFALTDAAVATIAGVHAAFGLPAHSSPLLWWLIAGVNFVLGTSLLAGIGRAAQEKPFA